MLSASLIFIIWTWGLTPLWVNIVVTCLLGINLMIGDCSEGEEVF